MRKDIQFRRGEAINRCAICDGNFGLIRRYSWRTALCSRKCVDRFKSRKENDRRWLLPISAAGRSVMAGIMSSRNEEAASESFVQAPPVELPCSLLATPAKQIALGGIR
jgi:hypothetical protein